MADRYEAVERRDGWYTLDGRQVLLGPVSEQRARMLASTLRLEASNARVGKLLATIRREWP